MDGLYSKLKLKNITLKNRIVMPPMCMYSATDGLANNWHYVHYGTRAVAGVGLIIVEATAVVPEGRISRHDLGLWGDAQVEPLQNIVNFVKKQGTFISIQLAHAGRKSEVEGMNHYAPSAIRFSDEYDMPTAMSKDDIDHVVWSFKEAAKRAKAAGFDAIELHGAHGYLINEFLSPLTNKRQDNYGGNLQNRTRFLVAIIRAVKTEWPDEKVLMLRLSADEYSEAGNTLDDIVEIVQIAQKEGVDLIDVSTGGLIAKAIKTYPGYQITHGTYIKEKTGITTLVGGLISQVELAEEIIQNNKGDLVYLGRELLRNPYFPMLNSKDINPESKWPVQYERAK